KLLENKYWVDEAYDASVVRPIGGLARFCWKVVDGIFVEGAVHTPGLLSRVAGELGRLTTTGNLRSYLFYAVFGMLVLAWWVLSS
ncbi:MAG: NADH-quinone oxidoreductase subunit L, partial [Thermoanaerobaculia bacterium]